jgi:two-component system, chemotaxis family, response regulator WspF
MTTDSSLLLIGASAGGPAASSAILQKLPANFPGAIILAQHVDSTFVPTLVDWLGKQCALPIHIAVDGDRPRGGSILVADSTKHLPFTSRNRLAYTVHPQNSHFHPSIDVLFQTAAKLPQQLRLCAW